MSIEGSTPPDRTTDTSAGCLRAAFQAVLAGNYAERDRLCERAKVLLQAENHAAAVQRVLAVDFYVTARGDVVPTKRMAKAAGAIQ